MAAVAAISACDSGAGNGPSATAAPSASGAPSASAGTGAGAALAPWPDLPHDGVALDALVKKRSLRKIGVQRPLDVERIIDALRDGTEQGELVSGWPAIVRTLDDTLGEAARRGRGAYLLVGSFHDAPGQVDAFRRLIGPGGMAGTTIAALEQLHADGSWGTVQTSEQAGDDAIVARFVEHGDVDAFATLQERQRQHDYTAWKYGYVERVTDLLTAARAAGRKLVGCDMPSALQSRVRVELGERGQRLRDLHCALALERARRGRPPPHRFALFLGDAHLLPESLPRFLAPDMRVVRVHLIGERTADAGLDVDLAAKLAIMEPLLVPIAAERFLLVLPDARLSARVDRARSDESVPQTEQHRIVLEGFDGEAWIGKKRMALAGRMNVDVEPGEIDFLLPHGSRLLAGTALIAQGGSLSLSAGADGVVSMHLRAPPR